MTVVDFLLFIEFFPMDQDHFASGRTTYGDFAIAGDIFHKVKENCTIFQHCFRCRIQGFHDPAGRCIRECKCTAGRIGQIDALPHLRIGSCSNLPRREFQTRIIFFAGADAVFQDRAVSNAPAQIADQYALVIQLQIQNEFGIALPHRFFTAKSIRSDLVVKAVAENDFGNIFTDIEVF